jgi:hypothetical protein
MQSLAERTAENLMAGKRLICPVLQKHYDLPRASKEKFLDIEEAKLLFGGLPLEVSKMLHDGFLSGTHGVNIPGWRKVVDYFQRHSEIIPALTENPGTFTMLERMYHLHPVFGVIDNYFLRCKAGGQALKNRYDIVNAKTVEFVNLVLSRQEKCLMADFGSGPGRNIIEVFKSNPDFGSRLKADCIDIDNVSLIKGRELADESGLTQISFIEGNMAKLSGRYHKNLDIGLLIGVLCGMSYKERLVLLKILKRYFRFGGIMIAAALLDEMAEEDLLCAYILRETAGWGLQYRPLGELKKIFEEAGWTYQGFFQDEPTKFYEIGVGIAP